ncbi:unnamed protein product, partial [Symbiodinium sp. CCMP2592]
SPSASPLAFQIGTDDEGGDPEEPDDDPIQDDDEDLKPTVPQNAGGFRAFRNAMLTTFAAIDKTGAGIILKWLQAALDPSITAQASRQLEQDRGGLPRLDAHLATLMADNKVLKGYSPAHLTTFKERVEISVEYMLNGMLESEWPSEETLFQFAYGRLKPYRGLARVIERIKESPKGSTKRSFSWIWSKLTEHLHELKEDQNEQSIREALLGKTTKPQEKATPAKPAPKAGPPKAKPTAANAKANAAATVALVLPSSAKAHSPSKASTVKHGWFARAFRVLCSYFSCVSPELACPAAVTSTVTVAANVMSGAPYFHEFIADSGAGRSLESRSSLIDQGIPGTEFSQKVRDDDKVVFSTGNGKVTSSKSLGFDGETFGSWKSYVLDSCPSVRSMGEIVELQGLRLFGYQDKCPPSYNLVVAPGDTAFEPVPDDDEAALDEITALDIPFSEITCSREAIRKRNEYITLDRVIKFGPTPGCGACAFETKTHTPVCRARFNALVKADRISKPSKPPVTVADDDKSKDDGTAVPPATSERVEFEELFGDQLPEDYAPKDTSLGNKEAVSEVPDDCLEYSPSEAEDEGSTHAAVILQIDDDFRQSNIDWNRCRRTSFVNQVLFEYPSSLDSQVGVVAEQSHITCVRLDRDLLDLSSQEDVDQLLGQVEALPGCDVWATMPDTHRCAAQGPKAKKPDASTKRKRAKQRHQEQKMLELALPVFQKCIDNFGRLSVEWPKGSELQNLPIWLEFEKKNVMRRAVCHGCMFGACGKHYPVKLPLVVSTNCIRTLETLSQYQCDQSHVHETVAVQTTSHSSKMAKAIIESYYPNKLHTFAPNHSHAFVTRNLPRKEWTANPKAVEAVKAEAAGLRNNETWDDSTARLLGDLKREARQTNRNVKIADILTLCGEKFSELPEEFRKFKGRVVYRGDKIYDELGNLVQFTDTATNPTAITALNVALWFACMPGNTASSSDAIQAFLQSVLPEETWVALPPELWLEEWHQRFKKGDRVVVRLRKSLYGHPLAGKLWEEHLASKLRELGGKELQSYPSNWDFEEQGHLHQDAAKILMKITCIQGSKKPGDGSGLEKKRWALIWKWRTYHIPCIQVSKKLGDGSGVEKKRGSEASAPGKVAKTPEAAAVAPKASKPQAAEAGH